MVGNIHYEDVADTPTGAKARFPLGDGGKKLIRMQASFHQELGFARTDKRNGSLC